MKVITDKAKNTDIIDFGFLVQIIVRTTVKIHLHVQTVPKMLEIGLLERFAGFTWARPTSLQQQLIEAGSVQGFNDPPELF